MSASVLVAYATRYGSTQEVAEAVTATLCESGLEVDIQLIRKVSTLEGYRAVVLGAPLYMFHWHKDALNFLSRHREALEIFGGKFDPMKLRFPLNLMPALRRCQQAIYGTGLRFAAGRVT